MRASALFRRARFRTPIQPSDSPIVVSIFYSSRLINLEGWEALWLIRKLQAESLKDTDSGSLIVEAIILQLLVITARCSRDEHSNTTRAWLSNVRKVTEHQYLNEFRLSELASVAGVHR